MAQNSDNNVIIPLVRSRNLSLYADTRTWMMMTTIFNNNACALYHNKRYSLASLVLQRALSLINNHNHNNDDGGDGARPRYCAAVLCNSGLQSLILGEYDMAYIMYYKALEILGGEGSISTVLDGGDGMPSLTSPLIWLRAGEACLCSLHGTRTRNIPEMSRKSSVPPPSPSLARLMFYNCLWCCDRQSSSMSKPNSIHLRQNVKHTVIMHLSYVSGILRLPCSKFDVSPGCTCLDCRLRCCIMLCYIAENAVSKGRIEFARAVMTSIPLRMRDASPSSPYECGTSMYKCHILRNIDTVRTVTSAAEYNIEKLDRVMMAYNT